MNQTKGWLVHSTVRVLILPTPKLYMQMVILTTETWRAVVLDIEMCPLNLATNLHLRKSISNLTVDLNTLQT